ncbi:hypothetical protein HII36_29700 [Nonomuraea sp. NN258]|uniref:hypothetical protein n=1 Tax=Nonomuraea antri TaxID=2730852 RepID=UPI0015681153|nr:hypothetical protein [Nonomuraea antri]NRQ35976.1 hypothetical protein [Nonomuraea antri]
MAIALAVNPAMGTGSPITSPTFSPPANSVLVAVLTAFVSGAVTVSNTVTPRTWTRQVVHPDTTGLAIYTAPNPTALTNITVSASADLIGGGLKVYVLTGAHASAFIGQTGTGASAVNNASPTAYTSSQAGSRGIAGALEAAGLGAPSSTDDESTVEIADIGAWGMALIKAANTATSGEAVPINLDAAGGGTPDWDWVALEILPASTDATANPATVNATAAVPAPAVSIGAGASPAAVTASVSVPSPGVSAGASTTPATVAASASVPSPSVTTESAEIVTPATVNLAAAVPAPAVSAGASAQPGSVLAAATVFLPDVDAVFNASVTLPAVQVAVTVDGATASVPVLPGDQLDGLAGQIEIYPGVVLGRGTPYRWQALEGWRGKDVPDSGNAPRANRHGSAPGRPYGRERVLTWSALLRVPRDEVEAAVLALENATPLLDTAEQWPIVINDLGTPYVSYGRIDRVHIPLDRLIRLGHAKIVLQWILADPRRYNVNATGVTVPLNTTVPISNAGNASTHPIVRIPGPATTPRMTNLTSNRVLEINTTVASGEELVVNTDLGTAKTGPPDNPTVDVPITDSSVSIDDWVLGRGSQDIRFTAASGGSQAEVLYKDAWN